MLITKVRLERRTDCFVLIIKYNNIVYQNVIHCVLYIISYFQTISTNSNFIIGV